MYMVYNLFSEIIHFKQVGRSASALLLLWAQLSMWQAIALLTTSQGDEIKMIYLWRTHVRVNARARTRARKCARVCANW